MATRSHLEDRIRELAALENLPSLAPDQVDRLRAALAGSQGLLIAAAARVIRKRMLADLAPDLVRAFDRLLAQPARADKGCAAKTALLEALDALDCHEETPFLQGVRFVQMEPTFGRTVDTAARVRAEAALGLARMAHPRAACEILPLLLDPEPESRAGAVRALAYLGGQSAELLLRMKALSGDEHPAIVGECLSALAKMDPVGSTDFIAPFLDSPDLAIVTEAAMALAGCPQPQAHEILCARRTSRTDPAFREALLLPIAMTRAPRALEVLREVILDEPIDAALAAVKAAAIHRLDPHWRSAIEQAVHLREDPTISQAFASSFGET